MSTAKESKVFYSLPEFQEDIKTLADQVRDMGYTGLYGIPKGGVPVAMALSEASKIPLVTSVSEGVLVVDDLIDTGRTRSRYPDNDMAVLHRKAWAPVDRQTVFCVHQDCKDWIVYWWEGTEEKSIEDIIIRQLQFIGEDPTREGLLETPGRVIKAWGELFSGYKQDPTTILKSFKDGACDEMVLLKDIEFYSTCLAGSTFIETPRGRIPIQYLKEGEFVYCWDEDACEMTIARASNPHITGRNKQLWRVYSDKDTVLCTGNHKFLTHTRGWIPAMNLVPGDSIVALNKGAIEWNKTAHAYVVWTGMNKAISESRFIYEKINGPLNGRFTHHIDKQHNNNAPENITALRNSDHISLHRLTDGPTGFALFTDKQRQDMRAKQIQGIRESQTEAVRKKRSDSVKAYWDSLSSADRAARNHRVLLVEQTNWREDVWCMDVPGYHNFVANGMVVHNCEHHMLPFFGKAHIAYIPDDRVVGISKLARLLEVFARRLQIQERLGQQITETLMQELKPKGAACILEAQHFCMVSRGVQKQDSVMVTSSLKGVFLEKPEVRAEFMGLIR